MQISQNLTQRMDQKLVMTRQMIQSIEMLQLPLMDLMQNINLENSPPDATCANGFGAIPLFALKSKSTLSLPEADGVMVSCKIVSAAGYFAMLIRQRINFKTILW